MLKEVVASNVAKLIAACVCPVVGTAAVTLGVPEVRQAVHRATAPKAKPKRVARAKPRVRAPAETADATAALPANIICPDPVMLTNVPLATPWLQPAAQSVAVPPERVAFAPAPVRFPRGPVLGGGFVPIGGGGGLPGGGGDPGDPDDGDGERELPPPPPPEIDLPPAVPEPATWAQMVVGFGVIGGVTRFAWKQREAKRAAAARG